MRALAAPWLVLLALLAACATPPPTTPVQVKILAINDFHGNLKPPQGGIRIRDPQDAGKSVNVPAGGSEHMATALNELRAKNPNHIFVAAGDLVGATPLVSALFHDEPTVEAMNLMGLEASAVGNHEFDKGSLELLRLQRGGCHPADGCKGPQPFAGAKFRYLGAGIVDTRSGIIPFSTVVTEAYSARREGRDIDLAETVARAEQQAIARAWVKLADQTVTYLDALKD